MYKKNMRKFFMAIVLCLICTLSFGQEWDKIGTYQKLHIETDGFVDYNTIRFCTCGYRINDTIYNGQKFDGWYHVPFEIVGTYDYGCKLFKSGIATISIGAGVSVVGGVLYGCGLIADNADVLRSGLLFTSLGSGLIGVSIPLFCVGDNLKRQANKDLETYHWIVNEN